MPVTLKPNDSIREHILHLHKPDKSATESTASTHKYMPSQEEIKKIAKLIEHLSGLKVNETMKKGELKIEFVTMKELLEMMERDKLSLVDELDAPQVIRDAIKIVIKKDKTDEKQTKDVGGRFDVKRNTIFLVHDHIEMLIRDGSVNLVKQGVVDGEVKRSLRHFLRKTADREAVKRTERFVVLLCTAHEMMHEISAENNPELGYSNWTKNSEQLRILSQAAKNMHDPSKVKNLIIELRENERLHHILDIYDETIAYHIGHLVLCKLGYEKESTYNLKRAMDESPELAKGIAFLEAIERTTHKNPVAFTIHNPPQNMQEIEDHKLYLRRTRGWKV
jgi:hypothetical protein